MLTLEDVTHRIQESWADLQLPFHDEVVPHHWGEYSECYRAFYQSKWEDLSFEHIMLNRACVTFLLLPALRYYLAAFMFASLREREAFPDRWDVTEYALLGVKHLFAPVRNMQDFGMLRTNAVLAYLRFLAQYTVTPEAKRDILECVAIVEQSMTTDA